MQSIAQNSALDIVLITSTIVLVMRTEHGALADLLFGRIRGGILSLLYAHSDQSFYVRQIARIVGGSVGTVQRELQTLSRLGLINRSTIGAQVFYQANRGHPVFAEIHALVAKTMGLFEVLRSALAPLAKRISLAFVYGSVARQEEKAESDVDLMIVGEVSLEDVIARLSVVERTLRRTVNPTLYSAAEFKAKFASGNHFLNSVVRGKKVYVIGGEDELGEMGGIRLAQSRTNKSRRDQRPSGHRGSRPKGR